MSMRHDQHFMVDEELASRIVGYANINPKDSILEIGPGKGALTKYLVKKSKVTAVEIDPMLCKELKKLKIKNLRVVNSNALDFYNKFDIVVSNLPYNICEPYFNKLIKRDFRVGVFCVPVSFANRLIKEKSLLSLVMPLFFKIKILEFVSKKVFSPQPKTDSVIISIEKRKHNTEKNNIIKEIYLQNDKKLNNAIEQAYNKILNLTKKHAKEKIPPLNFNKKRVYMLSYNEWKELILRL